MKKTKKLLFMIAMLAAGWFANAEEGETTWAKGEKLWEFRFTADEMKALPPQKTQGTTWLADEGIKGDGALYLAAVNGRVGTVNWNIPLDVAKFRGRVFMEADVKGRDLQRGAQGHHGPNIMLFLKFPDGSRQKNRWLKLPNEFGSFDWKTWALVADIPAEAEKLVFTGVLQGCRGELWIDAVRVYRAKEIPASEIKPPASNPAAERIPRGKWLGKTRPGAARGVMSGGDMSENAISTLRQWGANLVRLQLSVGKKPESIDEYFRLFAKRLEEAAAVVERCRRYGIRVCIDMHGAPNTTKTKHASNMLPKGYDTTDLKRAWRMVVERFGNDPVIYAYDILNEPSATPGEWQRVFREVVAEIRKLDKTTPVVTQSIARHYPPEMNVIYSPHIYQPHTLTHFGVGTFGVKWSYPGYINGVWWDREQQRVSAEAVIRFQCEHPDARIFVGEFSCVGWVKGADRWIADAIDLFEEYGWDWTYHAFREWQAWDVEREPEKLYDADDRHMRPAKQDTPRKIALLKGLARNGRPPLAK